MSPRHLFSVMVLNCSVRGNQTGQQVWQVHLTKLRWLHCLHHTPGFHPTQQDDVLLHRTIIRNGAIFIFFVTSEMWRHKRHQHYRNSAHCALCPWLHSVKVVNHPKVNNEEFWKCFYGIHEATIFMESFVLIHCSVEHESSQYLSWKSNSRTAQVLTADMSSPATRGNVWRA